MTNDDSNQSTGTLPAQPPTPSPTPPTPSSTETKSNATSTPSTTTSKPVVPTSAAATSNEPLREDMIKNAVSFLSSPNVRSADTAKKVAFLRQKGLTQPEIEEAFKRVGESGAPATAASTTTAAPTPAAVRSQPVTAPSRPPVPPRAHTQIVYYPLPPPEPMPLQKLVALAVLFGFGAVGLSAAVLRVIKHFLRPIFKSIADYQSNRYKERSVGFKSLNEKLLKEAGKEEKDEQEEKDENSQEEKETTTTTTKPLDQLGEKHQVMSDTLSRLVNMAQDRVQALKDNKPYSGLRDGLSSLRSTLEDSNDTYSSYSPYSSYGFGRSGSQDSPAVQGFKSEIRSFKGMLLNRRNFPMVNTSRPSSPSTATAQ
ncbi:hypothetical protein K492DRAFT_141752 [Lichtheimia hyalospora FSU 10163]|nr:hypothetical protein K492DRAFT_141752 [Lichtheimia hyalospora FSU 10163]